LLWYGSKWRIASWVQAFFPAHRIYVEPFGGSAGVLLSKQKARLEIYNDLNGDIVHFFRTLRDPTLGPELARRCGLTPYARVEQQEAWDARRNPPADPVERARLFWTANRLSIGTCGGGDARKSRPGFRFGTQKAVDEPSAAANAADGLLEVARRLRQVVIEQIDAMALFPRYDTPETLFYVDPPYNADFHAKYCASIDHHALLEACLSLEGFCIVSGYESELYADRLAGWHMETLESRTFRNKPITECLWISPRTWKALQKERRRAPMPLLRLCQPLCG